MSRHLLQADSCRVQSQPCTQAIALWSSQLEATFHLDACLQHNVPAPSAGVAEQPTRSAWAPCAQRRARRATLPCGRLGKMAVARLAPEAVCSVTVAILAQGALRADAITQACFAHVAGSTPPRASSGERLRPAARQCQHRRPSTTAPRFAQMDRLPATASKENYASAGNRTRFTSMATMCSTTRPLMLGRWREDTVLRAAQERGAAASQAWRRKGPTRI